MEKEKKSVNIFTKIGLMLTTIGPGIFLIGYNIGTGSVTTMASAGSRYNMTLFWALFLSCVFTFVMLVAYGKFTLVTGETAIYSFKKYFKYGKAISIFIMLVLIIGEIAALTGIMGIVGELLREWTKPLSPGGEGFNQIGITIVLIFGLYYLLWVGKYSLFEKFLIIFVIVKVTAFVLSMILVVPEPMVIIKGLVPGIPDEPNAYLIAGGMAGTTLSAAVFIIRSIVVSEKGWTVKDLKLERKDAFVSATVMLILSASIMACAAGTLYVMGKPVDRAIDMVTTLEPIAGRFAMSIFVAGIVSAGLSAVFPIILIAPWLICDYLHIPRNVQSPLFRILGAIAILFGLYTPIFHARPVWVMIASQSFQATIMPFVTIFMIILLNRKDIMGEHKIGFWMNLGCWLTFAFSIVMAYSGVVGLIDFLK
jgi:Mn2+/Fe2+ NRAMP family transporter